MIVEQFLPAFHYGDALGNSVQSLHRFLLKKGVDSRIIAISIDEILKDKALLFKDYQEEKQAVKILHMAVPSILTDYFINSNSRKVMIYHNITPAKFFVDYSDDLVKFTHQGRVHLKRLADGFDLAIADSAYNAQELKDLGYKNVAVFPLLVDLHEYNTSFSVPYYNLLKDERDNIIFVGRITPNKKIEDLIKVLFYFKKYLSPLIRLIIAGKTDTLPKYFNAVKDLASRFYLTSEDVIFTGHLPFDELLSVYRAGDIFLSMSEHEGFCLPLIESCHFQVPVVAYDAGAVASTLDGAGIVFKNKRIDLVAGLVERVLSDGQLKDHLKDNQRLRIKKYSEEAKPEIIFQLLREI